MSIKPEQRFPVRNLTPGQQASRKAHNKLVAEACERAGGVPTAEEIIGFLDERGLGAAPATILDDLKALGIRNPRRKRRRGRKSGRRLF